MKPPTNLGGYEPSLPQGEDGALVKMRTLKRLLAYIYRLIPEASGGVTVRRGSHGDIWYVDHQTMTPFSIINGKIMPGTVGGLMPTLDGEPLDTTSNRLSSSATGPVWFQLTFSTTFTEGYLSEWGLISVSVHTGSYVPSDSTSIKYLQFSYLTSGAAAPSFYSSAISVILADSGPGATLLIAS